jgi:magnesium transporter
MRQLSKFALLRDDSNMIVDYALYQNGQRYKEPSNLPELIMKAKNGGGFVWLGLAEPTQNEFDKIMGDFRFHPLAIEDAINAKQRPKFEEYPGVQFCVLKTVFYDEEKSLVSTGEIFCFIGEYFIVVVRHGDGAPLRNTRHQLEGNPEQLEKGPYAVLHAVIDHVIDCYIDIAAELEADVVEVESKVFNGKPQTQSQDIYFLKREIIEFRHAIDPLLSPLQKLASEGAPHIPSNLTPFFRDTLDHLSRASDAAAGLDSLLASALQADLAHVQVQQNADMRKITAYVALASIPTMVAGIYGMNFDFMPELRWKYGYPLVVGSLLFLTAFLYRKFKKSEWL